MASRGADQLGLPVHRQSCPTRRVIGQRDRGGARPAVRHARVRRGAPRRARRRARVAGAECVVLRGRVPPGRPAGEPETRLAVEISGGRTCRGLVDRPARPGLGCCGHDADLGVARRAAARRAVGGSGASQADACLGFWSARRLAGCRCRAEQPGRQRLAQCQRACRGPRARPWHLVDEQRAAASRYDERSAAGRLAAQSSGLLQRWVVPRADSSVARRREHGAGPAGPGPPTAVRLVRRDG
jgi:hypothetical protein